MDRKEKIYAYISHPDYKPLTAKELSIVLDVPKSDYSVFLLLISELLDEGKIVQSKKGRIKKASKPNGTIYGTLSMMKSLNAYVTPIDAKEEKSDEDIFIDKDSINYAFDGDVVAVKLTRTNSNEKHKHREGIVTKIIRRNTDEVIGSIKSDGVHTYFSPDKTKKLRALISSDSLYAEDGQKAVAKVLRYPDGSHTMKVKITEVLGNKDDVSTLTTCIVRENSIPDKFTDEALMQAKSVDAEVCESDIEGRKDFRDDNVITIDGEDARDLDDGVCIKKNENGYVLFVHIADVSHYVGENTAIDLCAYERATSVYLPDRVIPMLPRELSNGICSLNEGVDRLTMSATMYIDKSGNVYDYKIEEGVIRSKHRMTYTAVTKILEGDKELCEKYKDIKDDIFLMRELALVLKSARQKRGAIDFNFPEPKIALDDMGNVVGVKVYESGISNEIIEQFMLLANETIAKHACDNHLPFIFRVHEVPSEEKLISLEKYLNVFSVPFTHTSEEAITPMDIQKIVSSIKGTPNETAISELCLRSMAKARYAPENLGHFGLADEYYCHFTSPIRRYPDLVIHRILKESLKKGISKNRENYLISFVANAAKKSSDAEVRAVEAERDADKMCECLYMSQYIGEEFDARITSVTDFGIFVCVLGCIEGLVPMAKLCDDYYVYEDEFLRLRGERSGRIFALGDECLVRLTDSYAKLRRIDFEIVGMEKNLKQAKEPKTIHYKHKKASSKKQFKKFVKNKSRKKR